MFRLRDFVAQVATFSISTTRQYGWALRLIATYSFLWGGAVSALNLISFSVAKSFRSELLPAYMSGEVYFNRRVIDYASVVLSLALGLGIVGLVKAFPRLQILLRQIRWPYSFPLAIISLALAIRAPGGGAATPLFFAISFLIFAFLAPWPERLPTDHIGRFADTLSKSSAIVGTVMLFSIGLIAWYPVVLPPDYYELSEIISIPNSWMKPGSSVIDVNRADAIKYDIAPRDKFRQFLLTRRITMGQAYSLRDVYPTEFNAYTSANGIPSNADLKDLCRVRRATTVRFCEIFNAEINDEGLASETNGRALMEDEKASPAYFSMLVEAKNWRTLDPQSGEEIPLVCSVRQDNEPECNFLYRGLKQTKTEELLIAVQRIAHWNVLAGRLLFHHSYIFVPALHTIYYGLDGNVPFLYGYGNTLFHSAMMWATSPTLSSYFNTFPVGQALGFLSIFCLILYATRSVFAASSATALSIAFIYLVDSPTVYLAPGLSPLRYAGLCAQIASIFFILRGGKLRLAAIPATLVFSLFWNREFAVIGLIGQLLALAAPSLDGYRAARIICGAITLSLMVGVSLIPGNPDVLVNVQAGFFGVGLPQISVRHFVEFVAFSVVATGTLIFLANPMPMSERDARFALLPIIAILAVKFLFNAAPPHLFYTGAAAIPIMACYLPWCRTSLTRVCDPRWTATEQIITVLCLVFCLATGVRYIFQQRVFTEEYILPLKRYDWALLGDKIQATIPPEAFKEKIDAIKAELSPNQKVLFLSPFDHVLSFYANPKSYCGQFEIMTNLVSYKDIGKLVACIKRNPDTLVIYDSANEMLCPPKMFGAIYDNNGCRGKVLLKRALQAVWASLLPGASSVKKSGSISLMRMDPSKTEALTPIPAYKTMEDASLYEDLNWKTGR